MIELAAAIVVSAIAVSFATDVVSRAVKIVAPRRKASITVAPDDMSA